MAIDNSFGSGSSSGWSFSAGGSGAISSNGYNNSGTDHYWNPYVNSNAATPINLFISTQIVETTLLIQ